jgi:hypothetical protein
MSNCDREEKNRGVLIDFVINLTLSSCMKREIIFFGESRVNFCTRS